VTEYLYEFNYGYALTIQLGEKALTRLQELNDIRTLHFDTHFERKELEREAAELETQK
jgi:hypothetical protein